MRQVFIVAMEAEADAVKRHLSGMLKFEECGRTVYQGRFGEEETAVVVAGVGKVNAAAATQYAIDHFAPERIVNVGVAGGIDPKMNIADVFEVTKCFQCDFDLSSINQTPKGTPNEYTTPWFELDPLDRKTASVQQQDGSAASAARDQSSAAASAASEATAGVRRQVAGVVATGDFFANENTDRGFIYDEMGATLREMELGAIAHVCKRAGVRCSALKAVSDVNYPGCPPPAEQYPVNLRKAVDALAVAVEGCRGI